MSFEFELIAVREGSTGEEIDRGAIKQLVNTGYSPIDTLKYAPDGITEVPEADSSVERTVFENQRGEELSLVYSGEGANRDYSGIYISFGDDLLERDDWSEHIIEITSGIVAATSPDFACLTGGQTAGLPDTNDLSGEPGLGAVTYFGEKLLNRHEIRAKESEADIVREINGGLLVVPDEKLDRGQKYRKVASELGLDTT